MGVNFHSASTSRSAQKYYQCAMNSFWRYCLSHFEKELPAQQFATWIKPLKFEVDGDTLTVIAPNRFVLQWIRDKFYGRIQELAAEQLKRSVDVKLLLAEKQSAAADLRTVCCRRAATPQPHATSHGSIRLSRSTRS